MGQRMNQQKSWSYRPDQRRPVNLKCFRMVVVDRNSAFCGELFPFCDKLVFQFKKHALPANLNGRKPARIRLIQRRAPLLSFTEDRRLKTRKRLECSDLTESSYGH